MIHTKSNGRQAMMKFGKGDIGISGYELNGMGMVTFNNIEPREIGSCKYNPNISLKEHVKQSDVVMYFDNPESIDVLIKVLSEVKKNLLY